MMFERPHHQRIAEVLDALDGERLRTLQCWFGGGTAIALLHREYRESVDIDFLVSHLPGYRELRQHIGDGARNLDALQRPGTRPIVLDRPVRADRYGIRTAVVVGGQRIKFEIVHEARIHLEVPRASRAVCGIAVLTNTDLAASKLLANEDRGRDDSVFGRDAIDLAMMDLPPRLLRPAVEKAALAYGPAVVTTMRNAIAALRERDGWLDRCAAALSITLPAGVVQHRLRALDRRLARL